jgi:hypothetical protein
MANKNWPHGFRPLMIDLAGAPVGVNEYAKAAADSNAIFAFDLVKIAATSGSVGGQTIPSKGIAVAGATDVLVGAALNFGAASKGTLHTVVDDPLALFEAQCSGATSISVASHAGKNASPLATAQTNGTLLSAMQVDSSTIATTNTLGVQIRDLLRTPSNAEGANAVVEVRINKHQYANQVAGA